MCRWFLCIGSLLLVAIVVVAILWLWLLLMMVDHPVVGCYLKDMKYRCFRMFWLLVVKVCPESCIFVQPLVLALLSVFVVCG